MSLPPPSPAQSDFPVLLADRYRLDAVLGRGGFATVYRGEQLSVGRPVAIKVAHAGVAHQADPAPRFEIEARAVAALEHPHTVRLIDFGVSEGRCFLVMELVDGVTLDVALAETGPFAPRRALRVVTQVLEALAEAHDRQLVHRDIKPSNVMLTERHGAADYVKVLDFGIARALDVASELTASGAAIGSPRYMSPEQAAGEPAAAGSDVYAVGLLLYEMLTGRHPYRLDTARAYMVAHMTRDPPVLRREGRVLHGPLVDVTLAMLRKELGDRPQSAREALEGLQALRDLSDDELAAPRRARVDSAADLETLDQGAAVPRPPSGAHPRPVRSRAKWMAVGLAALAAAFALLALLPLTGSPAEGSPAQIEAVRAAAPTPVAPTPTEVAPTEVVQRDAPDPIHPVAVMAPMAEFQFTTSPPGAEVFVHGEVEGQTPFELRLPRGSYSVPVALVAPGYEVVVLNLAADESRSMHRDLERSQLEDDSGASGTRVGRSLRRAKPRTTKSPKRSKPQPDSALKDRDVEALLR